MPHYVENGTTKFPKSIRSATENETIFKPASSNSKLGAGRSKITKGRWKGFPLYSLTLVERETCPSSCHFWSKCYGNNLYLAARYANDVRLEDKIRAEVANLSRRYPNGFVIRLHVLGDFYSTEYVSLWQSLLDNYPQLNIFGFTARNSGDIGRSLSRLHSTYPKRFVVRFSVRDTDFRNYSVTDSSLLCAPLEGNEDKGVPCPQQDGKVRACIDCALCFDGGTTKPILWKEH